MENFDIDRLDAKTMRLIISIDKTKSVSDAAFNENLSQSTASYRLERVRAALADEVFTRGSSGMEPTVLGSKAIRAFSKILGELDELAEAKEFDPLSASRKFVVAATAFEIETIVAPLQRYLLTHAPGCNLIVHSMDKRNLVESLRDHWDLALLSVPPASSALKQKLLVEDELVTFYDATVREAPSTLDAYCCSDHAVSTLGGTATSGVDTALRKLNRSRKIKLVVSSLESLAPLMKGTSLITTIPSKLGAGLMRDFSVVQCPLDYPTIPFHAAWHLNKDGESWHRWLRSTVTGDFQSITGTNRK